MEPAANRVKTITTNAIVTVFSALMITMSGCAGIGTVTGPPPRMKMTTDIPESIIMPDTIKTRIGTLEFFDGFPADETVQKMQDYLYFHRAVDVFLDEMSTASILAIREGLRSVGVHECHQIAVFESLMDSKQYKLSEAKEPPQMTFISMAGKEANMLTNEGFAYFESLARYINENPPRSEDMAMLGILETIGIAHGRPFEPDERLLEILTEAAEVGRAMAKSIAWQPWIPIDVLYAYPEKRHWKYIFFGDPTFHTPDYMAIDQRSKYGFEAIGTAKSMVVAVPGQGSQYIGADQDSEGNWLSGENTYRIRLPKDVPANMFWSLTAYDNETRSLIQNDLGRPLVGSVHGAKANEDGSYDAYFGPERPEGVAKENWVQTRPKSGWFAYLRLYGPEQPYFDKTWIPGDAEKVK